MKRLIVTTCLLLAATPSFAALDPDNPGGIGGGGGGGQTGGEAPAPELTLSHINSTSNTIEITLSDGLVVVVDRGLNKMFVGHGSQSAEYPLVETLYRWAGDNPAAARAALAKIDAQLEAANGTSQFTPATSIQSSSISTGSLGFEAGTLMMHDGGFSNYYCADAFSCERVRTEWTGGGGGGGWGSYFFRFADTAYSYPEGGSDWYYWNRRRQDMCDSMQSEMLTSGVAAAGVVVGCGTAYTGIGAVVCGVSVAGLVVSMTQVAGDARECFAKYPGAGNW